MDSGTGRLHPGLKPPESATENTGHEAGPGKGEDILPPEYTFFDRGVKAAPSDTRPKKR